MPTAQTILFVDDEKHETKYFKKALEHVFSIKTADSVSQAIEVLHQHHNEIAIVITDQRMPRQLGVELLQYTQLHYPQMIRLLTTAFCDFDSAVDAINKAEVFRYIPKPWNLDDLEKTLRGALDRYSTLQSDSGDMLETKLLAELNDDCEHWFMYAMHAYGDEEVYHSGIEALMCRYHVLVNKHFEKDAARRVIKKMDKMVEQHYLNEQILDQLRQQKDVGFGMTGHTLKHH